MKHLNKKQRGVALVFGLGILTILSFLTIVAIQNSRFHTQIATNARWEERAFRSAEEQLAIAEQELLRLQNDCRCGNKTSGCTDPDNNPNTYTVSDLINDLKKKLGPGILDQANFEITDMLAGQPVTGQFTSCNKPISELYRIRVHNNSNLSIRGTQRTVESLYLFQWP
ncbi:hypothetical protein [Alcanivorax sp.]|uniref:pilus assembly PilX family protein n=1 Tax=Alcanivorax sp. TaxID=1872427 RepID=UPI002589DB66|nr:hypothetical protein [Alcanivorax sp.]